MTETDQERTAREWLKALGAEKDADTAVAEAMSKLDAARANTMKAYEAMKLAFSAEPPRPLIVGETYSQSDLAEDIREMQSQADNQGVYGVGSLKLTIKDKAAFATHFESFRERLNTETDETFNDSYGFTGLGQTSDPIRHDPD